MGNDARVRRLVLLALLALLAVAGCGGEEDPAATPAGAAQVRLNENLYDGRFEQAYADLLPAHQRIVSLARFIRCAKRASFVSVGDLQSIEVLDVFDEAVRIPGLRVRKAKAVRVRITSFSGETDTFVNHEVKVGGRWHWVLSDAAIQAYRSGACPGV